MRKHKLTFSPVPASSMQKARICPIEGFLAAFGGPGGVGAHRQGQKGTGHRMVSCPLLTPLTFLCADTSEMCSETGVTGARFRASGRFGDAVMP